MKYDVIIIKKPQNIAHAFIDGNLRYSYASSSAVKANLRCSSSYAAIFVPTGSWQGGKPYPLN